MSVTYHPTVQLDVNRILRHYDQISYQLGDAFWEELMTLIETADRSPRRFHSVDKGRRRVNLRRFPYHFLYRITNDGIRIVVVRHHSRDPQHGSGRL